MADKDVKEAGVEFGHAFKTFGKTFIRSAKTTTKKVVDWADEKEPEETPESTVYSDGSWKKTGKEVGSAVKGLASSIFNAVADEIDPPPQQNDTNENEENK